METKPLQTQPQLHIIEVSGDKEEKTQEKQGGGGGEGEGEGGGAGYVSDGVLETHF